MMNYADDWIYNSQLGLSVIVRSPILQMDFVAPIIAIFPRAFPRGTCTMSCKYNEFCGARSVIVQFAATGAITVGPTSCCPT